MSQDTLKSPKTIVPDRHDVKPSVTLPTDRADKPIPNISRRARRATLWTAAARFASQGSQLLTFVIASHFIAPKTYGTYGIVAVVVGFATLFNDLGVQAALVHRANLTPRVLSTAFWLNAGMGLLLAAGVSAFSFPAQSLFSMPGLGVALTLASLSFAFSVGAVPTALLERSLQFRQLAIIELSSGVLGNVCVIVGAACGWGLIALAAGPVIAAASLTIGLCAATRYIPRSRPSRTALRELWNFSSGMIQFNVANYFTRNIDNIALGLRGSAHDLGIYTRSYTLMTGPVLQVGGTVGRVLFPILARSTADREQFEDRWRKAAVAAVGIMLPISIACMATAPDFVAVLFDPTWSGMAPVLQVLSISAPAQILCATLGCVFQALGRTKLLFHVTLVQLALVTVGILGGISWGGVGVATGVAIASTVYAILPIRTGLRLMGARARVVGKDFLPIAIAAIAEAIAALLARRLLPENSTAALHLFVILICAGSGYAIGGYAVARKFHLLLTGVHSFSKEKSRC